MDPAAISSETNGGRTHGAWRKAARMLLSLLLGGMAILGAIVLVRQGLVPLVDALFHPGAAWLSMVRRIGIFLAALGGYGAYVRLYERRRATELHPKPLPALLGGAAGALMIGLPIAALFAFGAYRFVLFRGFSSALWSVAALILVAAMLEELMVRALLFRVLERTLGTGMALALQAPLFALQHLGNLVHASAFDAAAMLTSVTVLGLVWTALFVLTRNLWVGVAHHAAWNFTILLSGVPLSGIGDWRALAPLQSRAAGPAWLGGGQFGPESSLLVIATSIVAVALLLRYAKRRGCFVERQLT
jgi:membrane protease YdiL (CAAX protease family)